jgi:ATP-dependent RNA helicase DeaD
MQKMERGRIAKHSKITMHERALPTEEDLEKVVGERLTVLLECELRRKTRLEGERMRRFLPLAKSLAEDEDSVALLAMLLDEKYQQSLHAPSAQPDGETRPEQKRPKGGEKNASRRRRPRRGGKSGDN